MTDTALDRAVAQAGGDPADGRVLEALFDSELLLMLEGEPDGGADGTTVRPVLLALEDGPTALAFDRDERLAAFADGPVASARMPGRALVQMLAGRGVHLATNAGVSDHALVWGADTLVWAARFLAEAPEAAEARVAALTAPRPAGRLLEALGDRLAAMAALAAEAWLCGAEGADGRKGLLLVLRRRSTAPDAAEEAALARAVAEAGALAGAAPDVAFAAEGDALLLAARARGWGMELPEPEPPEDTTPAPPGSDPDTPPRLR